MRLNILFVISKVNYGGAGRMISFLANQLSDKGHKVALYTYAASSVHYDLNSDIYYIPEEKLYRNLVTKTIYPILQIRKNINKVKPDLIISFLPNANFFSILASFFKNIPIIINERSDPYYENNLTLQVMRFLYNFANKIVFQTEGAKNFYNKFIQRKSIIIPNPVINDYEPRIPLNQRKNEIAFVGRFDIHQKRQDLMIDAYSKIMNKHKDVKLVFYGDGPDMKKIQEMVKNKELSHNVIFPGKVTDVQERLRRSRIFVLTSDFEGIPNALLEAMAVGLPVISTDCSPGGARLLIQNNKDGLISPRDNAEELAHGIAYLLDNPVIAEKLGVNAQNSIKRFSSQKVMKMWEGVINSIEY